MEERGFQFPCEIPIKAMGRTGDTFRETVVEIVARHVTIDAARVTQRASGAGRFQSVTVPVVIENREQLEAIYGELDSCEAVLWTL